MSAHVVVGTDTPADRIIADMHVLPHCRFGVDYITVSFETEHVAGCHPPRVR